MKNLSQIKLLPITIFVAVMMLSVKVSNIHSALNALHSAEIEIASASAQNTEAKKIEDSQLLIWGIEQPFLAHY